MIYTIYNVDYLAALNEPLFSMTNFNKNKKKGKLILTNFILREEKNLKSLQQTVMFQSLIKNE